MEEVVAIGDEGQDDRALVARVAAGDSGAVADLYDRYGAACYRVALRVTANRSLAEEVVQEAFVALWQSRTYTERAGTVRSWILALAHHKAVDAVRRESALGRREAAHGAPEATGDPRGDPEAATLSRLRDGEVRAALLDLTDLQREALLLAYFGGHTQREIATMVGAPLGTVKTRTLSAMRKLQGRLSGLVEVPAEEST